VGRKVDVDDLIDAQGVASILGLSHAESVSTYLRRYSDMPGPVVRIPESRTRLWLRSEVIAWNRSRVARPARSRRPK
jgi:hypothetical protein